MLPDMIKDLNGDSWEELCQKCYKLKYSHLNYREIPARPGGDGGIEGFTSTGIVNQCYYPEGEYIDEEYHEYLRDKMSKDIKKLLNLEYKKRLIEFGVPVIKEWHFLVPKYRDNRILRHAKKKADEVKEIKKNNPNDYDYISDDFEIIVQDAENLQAEIYRVCVSDGWEKKIDFSLQDEGFNWQDCPSEKISNITRKIKAICKIEDDESVNGMVSMYAAAYIKGVALMNKLSESYKDMFYNLQLMINRYKKKVTHRTVLNPNTSENYNIFMAILDEFEKEIQERFPSLDDNSISELKDDMIGTWLADCSLQFR